MVISSEFVLLFSGSLDEVVESELQPKLLCVGTSKSSKSVYRISAKVCYPLVKILVSDNRPV